MKKSVLLPALVSVVFLNTTYAQDQAMINPNQALLTVNPSFAGSNGAVRDQFVYRNIWPQLSSGYVSYYNGLDAYVKSLGGGVALSGLVENQGHGMYKSSQINVAYARHLECGNGLKVIPSLQLGYIQTSADPASLTFGQMNAPVYRRSSFDLSAGLLFNYRNFYAGGSVFHINRPDIGIMGTSRLPGRYSLNASYNILLNESSLLNISAVYNRQQYYNSFTLAVNAVVMKHLQIGMGYISSDALFVTMGYRNDRFSILAGYVATYSRLADNTAGSWQLGIGFSFGRQVQSTIPVNFEKW